MRLLAFLLIAVAVVGCGKNAKAPSPPDLSRRVAAGQARAGKTQKPQDLIGGPNAMGKVGDYKIYNDRVSFIIEDARQSSGYNPYGGNVLDADLVRPEGQPGHSLFGEMFPAYELRCFRPDKGEIVNDGQDGKAAVIRFTGVDDHFPLLESVIKNISALHLAVTVEYRLAPGSDALQIVTTLHNAGDQRLEISGVDEGYIFGDGLKVALLPYGFDNPTGDAPFYFAGGDGVSYSVVVPGRTFRSSLTLSGLLLGSYGGTAIAAGKEMTYEQWIAVGDGSMTRHLDAHLRIAGQPIPAHGKITVTDEVTGDPIAKGRVHVYAGSAPGPTNYAGYFVTGADGSVEVQLAAGDYVAVVSQDGRAQSLPQPLSLGPGLSGTLTVPPRARVTVTVRDGSGTTIPAKLTFRPTKRPAPGAVGSGETVLSGESDHIVHAGRGTAAVELPPGSYRVYASRGFEWSLDSADIVLAAGDDQTLSLTLRHEVDTTGYLSADFHLHTQASADSDEPYAQKVNAFAAEGLEVPVSTDHEWITDYAPFIAAEGLQSYMFSVVGEEISTTTYGHVQGYPLQLDTGKPNNNAIDWYNLSFADVLRRIHQNPANPVVQINHPRSGATKGYFDCVGFDNQSFTALDAANWDPFGEGRFDALEVLNGTSMGDTEKQILPDWYSLLNRGAHVTATGDSDSHTSVFKEVGTPRNYLASSTDDPPRANLDELMGSVRNYRVLVSMGPFVRVSLNGKGMGELAALVGGKATLHVHIEAPAWMGPMDRLSVVGSGVEVVTRPLTAADVSPGNPAVRFDGDLDLPVAGDGWYLVKVYGAGSLDPVSRVGVKPFAFTNPIFLDANGDGTWTPPIH